MLMYAQLTPPSAAASFDAAEASSLFFSSQPGSSARPPGRQWQAQLQRRRPQTGSRAAAEARIAVLMERAAASDSRSAQPPPHGLRAKLANYGDAGFSVFLRKAFIKAMGYTDEALDRPIVGITNTFSGYNACHRTVPELIDAIKRGVTAAGGLPIEFPVTSIHEAFTSPTSMFLRNLMAMDAEELIRAQPMDAVVPIGGCDKTVPALLMGAASAGVPALMTVTGPMLTGSLKGEDLGACTDCRRLWGLHRGETTCPFNFAVCPCNSTVVLVIPLA